jgi:hypothetical protein
LSKILRPKEIPELMREKVRLHKMFINYRNQYQATGMHGDKIQAIGKRMREINERLGIGYRPVISGSQPLIKKAVGLTG